MPYKNPEQQHARNQAYYEANKEHIDQINKDYWEKHKEHLKEKNREYRLKHKDELVKKSKEYRERNKERLNAQQKQHRLAHLAEIKARRREHYKAHQQEINNKRRKYKLEHPELVKLASAKNYEKNKAIRKEQSQQYRDRLRTEVFTHYGNGKCACVKCGFSDMRALTIDHVNGGGCKHTESIGGGGVTLYIWLKHNNFPPDFQTLCINCNFIKRHERNEYANIHTHPLDKRVSTESTSPNPV